MMIKTTIICDCCRKEMAETTGAELRGQLRAKNIRWTEEGKMDLPVVELEHICDDCACELHNAISALCIDRTAARYSA